MTLIKRKKTNNISTCMAKSISPLKKFSVHQLHVDGSILKHNRLFPKRSNTKTLLQKHQPFQRK